MGVLTPVAKWIGRRPWVSHLLPEITAVDRALHRVSGGRVGLLDVAGLPNALLGVRGRRSGEWRTTPLLCARDGNGWLIAGSNFGAGATPGWVHNLRAAPTATLSRKGRVATVTARELPPGERTAAWAAMCRVWPNLSVYQQRTDRTIPVFRLTPAPRPNHDCPARERRRAGSVSRAGVTGRPDRWWRRCG